MKTILNLFYAVLILSVTFAFGMATGNVVFASVLTGSVAVFSAMIHTNAFGMGKLAMGAPVIPDFTHKSKAEINDLSEEDFQKYLDEKEKYDQAVADKARYDAVEELKKDITEDNEEQIKAAIAEINKGFEDQKKESENLFLMIRAASEKTSPEVQRESLKALIEKNSKVLEGIKERSANSRPTVGTISDFNLQLKHAVGQRLKATQGASDIGDRDYLGEIEPGIEHKAVRDPRIMDLFSKQPISKEYLHYWEQDTVTRDADFVIACATSSHNTKVTWVKRSVELAKIRDIVEICIDMLDDYDFVEGEIRMLINESINLTIDNELLNGSAAAATDLLSIDSISSEFNASNALADFSNDIADANISDLLTCMKAQITVFGQENKWMPDVAVMNYIDWTKLYLEKDEDGNYLFPNIIFGGRQEINGMRIVTTPICAADSCYVFDSTKGKILDRRKLTVTASFENNDNIEKELVTFVAVQRLQFHVRNINRDAFMKCSDIPAALVAIDDTLS